MKTPASTSAIAFVTLAFTTTSTFGQGSLTPPGAPAATMRTLTQIEPRTPISSAPFTISQPGSYYLTGNVSVASGDGITINANNVRLDLRGFGVTSTAASTSGTGILLGNAVNNVTICNGAISGSVTYNGVSYTGGGFIHGISYSGTTPENIRVSNLTVSGCGLRGIDLGTDYYPTSVDHCNVRNVGEKGIIAGTISDSTAVQCGSTGIFGNVASNSIAYVTGPQDAIFVSTASNCLGLNAGAGGAGVDAYVAINCWGFAASGSGILAHTATGCQGTSTSGEGVTADNANGCEGNSTSAAAVHASIAQNCYGVSNGSGRGVSAVYATGCSGSSATGLGLGADTMANGCYGKTAGHNVYGLQAPVAINCYGQYDGDGGSPVAYAIYASQEAIGCYSFNSHNNTFGILTNVANACVGGGVSAPNKFNMPP